MAPNGKKFLYILYLALSLVYLYIVVEDVADPGTFGKTHSSGDTDNSIRFILLEVFQLDFFLMTLTFVPVYRDIIKGHRLFFPGILALAMYALANTIYLLYNIFTFDLQYTGIILIMIKMLIELVFLVMALRAWLRRNISY